MSILAYEIVRHGQAETGIDLMDCAMDTGADVDVAIDLAGAF
jgi:hypothetical protein